MNADIPRDLETIALKCLQKERRKRYASARELADELQRFLDGKAIRARPISTAARAWRWCRRNPVVAALITVSVMAIGVALAVATGAYFNSQRLLADAQQARNTAQGESRRAKTESEHAEAESKRAIEAQQAEAQQRRKAETSLVDMYTSHGLSASDRNDYQEALLWFATAAVAAQSDEKREWANRLRFRNWLRHVAAPIYAMRNDNGRIIDLEMHPGNGHVLLHTTEGDAIWDLKHGDVSLHRQSHVAWSHDGALLAVGRPDGVLEILRFPQQTLLHRHELGDRRAARVVFSRDGKMLAVGAQNVKVWHLANGKLLSGESAHPDLLLSLEFGRDNDCLITSCKDGTARVFGVADEGLDSAPRFPPKDHRPEAFIFSGAGFGCKFFPPLIAEGGIFLVADQSTRLAAIDIHTGHTVAVLPNDGRLIAAAAISGDGQLLAMSADPNGAVQTHDVANRARLTTGNTRLASIKLSQDRIPGLAFWPGRSDLATIGHDATLRIWNCRDGKPSGAAFVQQGLCEVLAFSPDGTLCTTAQPDQIVRVLRMPLAASEADAASIIGLDSWFPEPASDVHARWVATPGTQWGLSGAELRVYSTSSGDPASVALPIGRELLGSALSEDGRVVAAFTPASQTRRIDRGPQFAEYTNRSGRIVLWDWAQARQRGEAIITQSVPLDGAFSPDGETLVVVCANGDVLLIDAHQPRIVTARAHPGSPIYGTERRKMVRFTQRGDFFITLGFGKSVRMWTIGGTLDAELSHPGNVYDANFSTQGDCLATTCENGDVRVWQVPGGAPVGATLTHPDAVWSVKFDPLGKLVVTGCRDKNARVWNWRTGELACPALKHVGRVFSAEFVGANGLLVTAADWELGFWETDTAMRIAPRRSSRVFEPRLVLDKHGIRGVAAGTQRDVMDVKNRIEAFSLVEVDTVQQLELPREALVCLAEVVAGRRAVGGGSEYLTSGQWFERWQSLRADFPEARMTLADAPGLSAWRRHLMEKAERAEDWSNALFQADQLLATAPADQDLLAHKAAYLYKLRRPAEASETIRQAVSAVDTLEDSTQTAAIVLRLAEACRSLVLDHERPSDNVPNEGDTSREWWAAAVNFYTRAIRCGADSHDVWIERAQCQRHLASVSYDADLPRDSSGPPLHLSEVQVDGAVAAHSTAAQGTMAERRGWRPDAPAPAIAPFDVAQATKHQQEWADYLHLPLERINSIGMVFILIPPGEFMMGSTPEEIAAVLSSVRPDDRRWFECMRSTLPRHKVVLTRPIYLGAGEVTQKQYEAVMGANPSYFTKIRPQTADLDTGNFPVECVSWNDAVEFCAKLSQKEELKPFYSRTSETVTSLEGTGYRLPTEAEWEFACRAGTTTGFWSGDREQDLISAGWFGRNSSGRTHEIGELARNAFGLLDVHGNVFEWVEDSWEPRFYERFANSPAIDPRCPIFPGSQHMARGGDWDPYAFECFSSVRYYHDPRWRQNVIGFRVALVAMDLPRSSR